MEEVSYEKEWKNGSKGRAGMKEVREEER